MKMTIAMLSLTTALSFSTYALAADSSAKAQSNVEYKDNGGYTATTSSDQTDASGTQKTTKHTEDMDVDSKGNATKQVKTKVTTDPKGLGNEAVQSSDIKTKEKDNGGYSKTVKTKSTGGTGADVTTNANTDVDVDSKGNVTKTTKTQKTVDPKTGLFSGQTTTTKTKSVNGKVVEEEKQAPDTSNQ